MHGHFVRLCSVSSAASHSQLPFPRATSAILRSTLALAYIRIDDSEDLSFITGAQLAAAVTGIYGRSGEVLRVRADAFLIFVRHTIQNIRKGRDRGEQSD
jgi:hypothetical protein